MSYINGENCLPKELIKEIQKYIDGQHIYIPKAEDNRKSWGSNTETKKELAKRNQAIYLDYLNGAKTSFLAGHYYLSVKSIQRIILSEKRKSGHKIAG